MKISDARGLGSLSACFLHAGGILAVLKSRDGRILTVDLGEKRKSRTPQKLGTVGAGSWYGDLNHSRTRILREKRRVCEKIPLDSLRYLPSNPPPSTHGAMGRGRGVGD